MAGASAELIADGYEAGVRAVAHHGPKFAELPTSETNQQLDDWAAHLRAAMLTAAAPGDIEQYLLKDGVQETEIGAIRSRPLTP